MRAVRNSARMQRDRRRLDAAARTEISADVKQYFVRFDVVVHPWNFHCFGVSIEQARRERANHVAADLERLMNRRRLMDRAGNWLEILRIEGEGIDEPIPTNDIEGIMRHCDNRPARAV